jgi:hypothetical protein
MTHSGPLVVLVHPLPPPVLEVSPASQAGLQGSTIRIQLLQTSSPNSLAKEVQERNLQMKIRNLRSVEARVAVRVQDRMQNTSLEMCLRNCSRRKWRGSYRSGDGRARERELSWAISSEICQAR